MFKSERNGISPALIWTSLIICSLGYYMVSFHRMAPAVMASELKAEFSTSSTVLGLLSSVYFIVYGLVQIPIGYLVDRYNPGKVMGIFTAFAAVGSVLFGMSTSFGAALFARGLTSLGLAAIYVPATKLFGQILDRKGFMLATGIILGIGNFGSLTATGPLAAIVEGIGWRAAFYMMGGATAVISILMVTIMGRAKLVGTSADGKARRASSRKASGYDVAFALVLGLGIFLKNGPMFSFQGLWGVPYVMDVHGLTRMEASSVMMLMALSASLAGLLTGVLNKVSGIGERRMMSITSILYAVSWIPIAIPLGAYAIPSLKATSLVFGSTSTIVGITMQAVIVGGVDESVRGAVVGFVNSMSIAGGAVFQPLMGYILDRAQASGEGLASGYSSALILDLLAVTVSAALFITAAMLAKKTEGKLDSQASGLEAAR